MVWAISPDGRATNLGEVLVNKNGAGKLTATTELQIFGMVSTAEPYFAVRQPSDVIVAMNQIRKNTRGKLYFIDAKFELLKRRQYEPLANPLAPAVDLKAAPLELYEARNAVTNRALDRRRPIRAGSLQEGRGQSDHGRARPQEAIVHRPSPGLQVI